MNLKAILAKVIASAMSKTAVVSVVGVTAGAVAATGVTTLTYKNEIKQYKDVIASNAMDEYKENSLGDGSKVAQAENAPTLSSLEGQSLRVFDGMIQVYTEEGWTDYATVDDIERQDPFYGADEKRAAVELKVLNEKLEEAGIVLNDDGKLVASNVEEKQEIFKVGSIVIEKFGTAAKNTESRPKAGVAGVKLDPATEAALKAYKAVDPQAAAVIEQAIVTGDTSVISSGGGSDSGSSGGGSYSYSGGGSSGGSSGSSGSSGGGGYSAPSTPTYSAPSTDSWSGSSDSGSSDSGSSDSGSSDSGSSDSGSSDSGSSDDGGHDDHDDGGHDDGDGQDFGGDAW